MLILPCTVVTFIAYIGITESGHGSFYFAGVSGNVAGETTLHFPFTHPHLPAPQSIGPSQTFVHSWVQTPLLALLMQLSGWQHSACTQSSSVMQSCNAEGDVVNTVVGSEGVGVGETVTGEEPEVHPLTITRPTVKRSRTTSKPE